MAFALWALGEQENNTALLQDAVAADSEALKERTRERAPFDWAAIQTGLGFALEALGERENNTALLQDAVAAYNEALKECTRERVPLDSARNPNELQALHWRRSGSRGSTHRSAPRCSSGLQRSLERVCRASEGAARLGEDQTDLGFALAALGERRINTALLQEAVAAYEEALKERTRERVPLDWARTKISFGWKP